MNIVDDDRFRRPGSRYEHEEPVAFAVIPEGSMIDWSDAAHSHESTLWLPEVMFQELASATRLGTLNLHEQSRLGHHECQALSEELAVLEATSAEPDVRTAAALVRKRSEVVVASPPGQVLLVEGP